MKIPVYITTTASKFIGEIDIDKLEDFDDAAEALWEAMGYESPSICHSCSDEIELGDFDINTDTAKFYFEETK